MAYKIIIQPQAEADIEFAYQYISGFSLRSATNWRFEIFSVIITLSTLPNRYALTPEAENLEYELKQLIHGRRTSCYRVIYRVIEEINEVHILTVRHASRQPLNIEDLE